MDSCRGRNERKLEMEELVVEKNTTKMSERARPWLVSFGIA